MFSILIPSLNNLDYLKLCIKSIKKNSSLKHEIIVHVNKGEDGTIEFLKNENIKFSFTKYNAGICEGVNLAAKLTTTNYFLYAHDDFYFCPDWDEILFNEVKKIGHNNFYLSGTMMHNGQIAFNCGESPNNFNEKKFLNEYKNHNLYDFQGTTWAPMLVHKEIWEKVGGFSEEFFPGTGSDPDFNMKLWNQGVRIFKGINNCKVYHFGSIVLRRKINEIYNKPNYGSKGAKLFLLKWGITIKFFKKYYLQSNTKYKKSLVKPDYNISFILNYLICKLYFLYLKLFYNKQILRKSL